MMKVGNREFAGKGAREEGAAALTTTILSQRKDLNLQVRATFRGFEILSRGTMVSTSTAVITGSR